MFRFATVLVLVASALVVGQSAVRNQRDLPLAAEAAQPAPGPTNVPQQINHQGVVSVEGLRFNGTGIFKFAIVDPTTGINLWCNDDNDPVDTLQTCAGQIGVVPATSCSLTVTDGVYSIGLGDSDLACMRVIPPSIFNVNNTRLRIWFDDGANGLQQLTPDQKLTATPYAHTAAIGVPPGTMVAFAGAAAPDGWMLCDGRTVSRLDFPDLYNAIGEAWGAGVDSTMFKIPDLRGRFVRGVEVMPTSPVAVPSPRRDPDALSRTVGSIQQDATSRPNVPFHTAPNTHSHTIPGSFLDIAPGGGTGHGTTGQMLTNPNSHSHEITSGGDAETRPVNANVTWIIKH